MAGQVITVVIVCLVAVGTVAWRAWDRVRVRRRKGADAEMEPPWPTWLRGSRGN